jgi:hypothetical protein
MASQMEGRVGFEPTTRGLKVPCSATELTAHRFVLRLAAVHEDHISLQPPSTAHPARNRSRDQTSGQASRTHWIAAGRRDASASVLSCAASCCCS